MEVKNEIFTQKVINLIVKRRKEIGISQTKLANRCGLPQSAVARIENHKLNPRLDTLVKILTILEVDIAFVSNSVIKTEHLILRKFKESDAQDMFDGWCNDPEVTKYMTWNPHENIQVTQAILNNWIKEYDNPDTIRYAITLKNSGELIGSIDIVNFIDGNPEIGYCLSRSYWNNGYMTEACQAFIKHLFRIGFKKLLIEAKTDNIASNRVIEKCGFSFTHQETRTPWSVFKPESVTVNWYEISVVKEKR